MLRSSTHAIAAMLVRAGAVVIFCECAFAVATLFSERRILDSEPTLGISLGLSISGSVLLSVFMWLFAGSIASAALARRSSTAGIESNIDANGWVRIAIASIGVYQISQALLGFIRLVVWSGTGELKQLRIGGFPEVMRFIAEPLTQLIAGLILLLGARGIVNLFNAIRDRGMPRDDAPPPATPTKEDA